MRAIAEVMHHQGGMDVFVPLLQGHGLKQPNGMKEVSHQVWIRNAAWAIVQARRSARRLSVGGLSTGGSLAVLWHSAIRMARVSAVATSAQCRV
jgi:esterase/lipase